VIRRYVPVLFGYFAGALIMWIDTPWMAVTSGAVLLAAGIKLVEVMCPAVKETPAATAREIRRERKAGRLVLP
jgi:hypothetical protein